MEELEKELWDLAGIKIGEAEQYLSEEKGKMTKKIVKNGRKIMHNFQKIFVHKHKKLCKMLFFEGKYVL